MTMREQVEGLLSLDRDAIDVRKGFTGLGSILAFGIFVAVFGDIGMVAALATLFVILADQPGALRDRGLGVLVMTVVGTIIALIGVWAGPQHALVASLLVFIVVALATLAAGFGPALAIRGMLLSVWVVVAISLAGETQSALQLALAFAGGGLVAAGILYVRARALPEPPLERQAGVASRTLEQIVRSPLGWFALVRAATAALAMYLGAALFPDHPIWAALTVILVMKPKAGETVASGILRTLGTVLGVIVADAVIAASDGEVVVITIGFLLAGFGMVALQKVNYAIFVACLTALLVLADQLASGSGNATAADRLLATLLGAALALVAIGIGRVILGRPIVGVQEDPPGDTEDRTPG